MPYIKAVFLVPDGMTGREFHDLFVKSDLFKKKGIVIGEPLVTQVASVDADLPLDDDDEVDLTPEIDEGDESSDDSR